MPMIPAITPTLAVSAWVRRIKPMTAANSSV